MKYLFRSVLVMTMTFLLATGSLVANATPGAAAGKVPAQFIAKMYSEALGRMPDPGGWSSFVDNFNTHGCTTGMVRETVRAFFTSSEFLGLGYDNPARLLSLYRGALNREPDQGGFDHYAGLLDRGELSWSQVVDVFAGSPELGNLAATICGPATGYAFGTQPAPTLPTSGSGFTGGTGEQLQQLLDAAPAGGTVYLAQKAVVRLTSMLDIPAGVTLTTVGAPGPDRYAMQGRLVRLSGFDDDPMVRLEPGARLQNVWVDGQRGSYANFKAAAINVQLMGGDGTTVSDAKISNSQGWSSLQAFGTNEGFPCASTVIRGNLVTAYSSDHYPSPGGGRWTDGLSVSCEHALIEDNGIIDATDVGIVLFRANPAVQASVVRGNQVLSAGNSAYGALAVDGLYDKGTTPDFSAATMSGNAFWTGPDTHFDIGLAIGSRPWFGTRSDAGTGMSARGNTTNGLTANVGTGIAVSGMYRATVRDNDLRLSIQSVNACPHVTVGVDADGYAAGSDVQPPATPVRFTNQGGGGCLGH